MIFLTEAQLFFGLGLVATLSVALYIFSRALKLTITERIEMDFSKIQELLNQLPALLQTIESLKAQAADAAALVEVEKKASYEKGFADGVASVPVSDKLYNQAEVDAMIASATEPLQMKVTDLEAGMAELSEQLKVMAESVDAKVAEGIEKWKEGYRAALAEIETLKNEMSAKVSEAVSAAKVEWKKELLAQFEAQQASESESEALFKKILSE